MSHELIMPHEAGADRDDGAAPVPRVNVLGVGISAVDQDRAADEVEGWIASGTNDYVCVTGVHGVMECQTDAQLLSIHNGAGLVVPDGMPMVWLSKVHGHRSVERVYGPDLMLELCRRSVTGGYAHFLYGGAPGVPELLATRLGERFPGLAIADTYSPPFRQLTDSEELEVIRRIDESGAAIVWVGLSTPKQERWMHHMRNKVRRAVFIGVGAAFDFHAGRKRQAPRWMQRSGLEWFFRLLTEPRRLGKRYLINNPRFLYLTALQLTGLRRFADPAALHDPEHGTGS